MTRSLGTVLIADDEAEFARDVLAFPMRKACDVLLAYNVPQALALIDATPSLHGAIVDYGMPGGNGLQVLAALRRRHPSIPAMLLTGHLRRDLACESYALDVQYVLKENCDEVVRIFVDRLRVLRGPTEGTVEQRAAAYARAHRLSPRETDILLLAVAELAHHEICERLQISPNTLKHHVRSLLEKCGAERLYDVARELRQWARGAS
jgi:DNA-binding NarL/FixJ family response regulator